MILTFDVEEHAQLSRKAIKILLLFLATYLCKVKFSPYTSTKITYHGRLNAEVDMKIQVPFINPNIKRVAEMQNNATLLAKLF